MNRQERDEDRELQRKLREDREAAKAMRRQANEDLQAGHAAEHARLAGKRDEHVAAGFQPDPEFERAVAELERTDQMNPSWRTRAGYYENRKAAAERVARRDRK